MRNLKVVLVAGAVSALSGSAFAKSFNPAAPGKPSVQDVKKKKKETTTEKKTEEKKDDETGTTEKKTEETEKTAPQEE